MTRWYLIIYTAITCIVTKHGYRVHDTGKAFMIMNFKQPWLFLVNAANLHRIIQAMDTKYKFQRMSYKNHAALVRVILVTISLRDGIMHLVRCFCVICR